MPKEYTCTICGETVSKRQSRSYKDGRACRHHSEVQEVIETEERERKDKIDNAGPCKGCANLEYIRTHTTPYLVKCRKHWFVEDRTRCFDHVLRKPEMHLLAKVSTVSAIQSMPVVLSLKGLSEEHIVLKMEDYLTQVIYHYGDDFFKEVVEEVHKKGELTPEEFTEAILTGSELTKLKNQKQDGIQT